MNKTDRPKVYLACRIRLDGEEWHCSAFRTRQQNLAGAWKKLAIDYGYKYLPQSWEDFQRRGGEIAWYRQS